MSGRKERGKFMKNKHFVKLDYIHFRYQRLTKLIEMVEVAVKSEEYSKNAVEWALLEIENCLDENNAQLEKLMKDIPITKTEAENC